jgi:hypothetical protein
MKEVTFEWILDATGIEPKRLKRIMNSLVERGWWVKTETGYLMTAEGLREVLDGDLYGYQGIIFVSEVLKVRNLIRELSKTSPGTEITVQTVFNRFPELYLTDKKIGRLLKNLGCKARTSKSIVYYKIPKKPTECQLADLTGPKYCKFKKFKCSETAPSLCKPVNQKMQSHGTLEDVTDILKDVFNIKFFDHVEFVDEGKCKPEFKEEYEKGYVWDVEILEKQREFLPLLEEVAGKYRKTVLAYRKALKSKGLKLLVFEDFFSEFIGDMPIYELNEQEAWIKRWIKDLKNGFFIGYLF